MGVGWQGDRERRKMGEKRKRRKTMKKGDRIILFLLLRFI
jgi:hypothetical protein